MACSRARRNAATTWAAPLSAFAYIRALGITITVMAMTIPTTAMTTSISISEVPASPRRVVDVRVFKDTLAITEAFCKTWATTPNAGSA